MASYMLATHDTSWLWHRRLRYAEKDALQTLIKQELLKGARAGTLELF